jgi:hypothetical protein
MKKQILLFTLFITVFATAQTIKFEKPRYLKFATFLTPIDMSQEFGQGGVLSRNTSTVEIKDVDTKDFESRVGEDGNEVKVRKVIKDTLLLKNIMIEKGYAFEVVKEIGSFSIIKFWSLEKSTGKSLIQTLNSNKKSNPNTASDTYDINKTYTSLVIDGLVAIDGSNKIDLTKTYFILPTKTLISNSVEFDNKKGMWNIGLLVMPVKIRPFATESGQFDFSDGVSVGTTLSWTVHHNFRTNFTHNVLLYVGVSSYTADESKIKETREDYKIATFSPAVGWMWEKNRVQLSLLAGVDFPSGTIQKNWVYRNMPWFGMGLGIGLFNINNDNSSKESTQVKP